MPRDVDALCRRLPSTCTAENHYCATFHNPGIDLVIPTYEAELCKLELLARSVAVHDVCGLISDAHVGWITTASLLDYREHFARVESVLGPRRKVYYVDRQARALRNLEANHGHTSQGWLEQQLFKLEAHAVVNTTWYLILDSKNIFVNPITLASLFSYHRNSLISLQEIPNLIDANDAYNKSEWYLGAAKALNVSIPETRLLKKTTTPFLFNADRVRALFAWMRDRDVTLEELIKGERNGVKRDPHRHTHDLSEFTLYEAFTCCHPAGRESESDPWREAFPVEEMLAHPHENLMRFHHHYADAALSAEVLADIGNRAVNRTAFDELLLVGWHKAIPSNGSSYVVRRQPVLANGTFFADFVRGLASLYKRGGVIRDVEEECAFYAHCASAVVTCDTESRPFPPRQRPLPPPNATSG